MIIRLGRRNSERRGRTRVPVFTTKSPITLDIISSYANPSRRIRGSRFAFHKLNQSLVRFCSSHSLLSSVREFSCHGLDFCICFVVERTTRVINITLSSKNVQPPFPTRNGVRAVGGEKYLYLVWSGGGFSSRSVLDRVHGGLFLIFVLERIVMELKRAET